MLECFYKRIFALNLIIPKQAMSIIRALVTSALSLITATTLASTPADGFPIANFSVTANAGADGSLFGSTMVNPGKLGDWLEKQGEFPISFKVGEVPVPLSLISSKIVERKFPIVHNVYGASNLIPAEVSITAFAPLALDNVEVSSLPVLLAEIDFSGIVSDRDVTLVVSHEGVTPKTKAVPVAYATDNHECVVTDSTMEIPVGLMTDDHRRVRIAIAMLDSLTLASAHYSTAQMLADDAIRRFDTLLDFTKRFSKAIPTSGDKEIDEYLRWYMIPAISLTKCTADGNIVTMGYRELNQRDSYWTSWVHLPMFPSAERRMIEESVDAITPSGKIPTTILPLIDRKDDLDINAFFILRLDRYFKAYPAAEMPDNWWNALTAAADWLISRDTDGDGIPVQNSFWGDWKDVKGIEGRKYSPFTALLYESSMRAMAGMADKLGHNELAAKYNTAADRAHRFINTPTEKGGLWNGEYYVQRWADGSVNDHLLQDQAVGILMGVVPTDRAESIFNALNSRSLTRYGVCETFPYYPASFGYAPATYHNGAVWPWVSFMDDWARLRSGRTEEALDLIKRVGKADLDDSGDWSPNEHINSLTGENLGFMLQGWNSNLFGLVYYGIVNPGIVF